jgi:hypothetical protein
MPTMGLIVEGPYDEAVLDTLVKRCRPGIKVITRKCRGPIIGRFAGIATELDRSYRIEKLLVVADADGRNPASLAKQIQSKVVRNYSFPVAPVIIVQELEAWLIADPRALESVVSTKKGFRGFPNPEKIRDPKAALRSASPSTVYTTEIARRIAEKVDLTVLDQRCPMFSKFREAISDP